MDLDSKTYFKLYLARLNNINFIKYIRITDALSFLKEIYDYKIPEI
jgi:hypothetical protein